MKPTLLRAYQPLSLNRPLSGTPTKILTRTPRTDPDSPIAMPQLISTGLPPGESIRHILLGSTGAIHHTIHLLHALGYAETLLWSPLVMVEESLIITPAQGEAMSLLRKQI
ncbi:MAG: hypothetical protein WA885_21970 [Phormidesmis sp.]